MRFNMLLILTLLLLTTFLPFSSVASVIYIGTWDAASGNNLKYGITMNDTYIWITDSSGLVYKYYNNGTYTDTTWDTGITSPKGITMNDTYFWVTDILNTQVRQYYQNGTYTGTSWSTTTSGNDYPFGITMNDTYFWIVDVTDDEVYQYYHNGTYTDTSWDTAASGNVNPSGITMNNTYFWVTDKVDDLVYKYYHNGTYTSVTFDCTNYPVGITMNTSNFWVIDDDIGGAIYQYYINTIPITSSLQTESQTNPTQIYTNTTAPHFNWTYTDPNETQYSWQIYVGTTLGASDMWDSGQLLGADTSDIYAGSALSRNTTYYVQARTNDGYENSIWETGTFKINALPVIANIVITPGAPLDTDDLTATNDTATDGNGDSINLYYRWYKDDVLQTALNDIVTINSSNTTDDEVWKVGIIPNDSYENGSEVFSGTVTIGSGNYAPTLTSITTNVSTKKYGYDILVSTVDAFDQNDDNYILHVGSTTGASDICNSSSTPNGTEASCSFTVNWTSGDHTLYGRLTDANDTSIEKTIIITVDTTPPVIGTNSVSPTSITTDENNTVTASVTVANGSVDWVKVKIRNPNIISTNYTMTGVNGTYTYTFSPGPAGHYSITNFYAADDSGNTIDESVSLEFEVVTGSTGGSPGGGGPAPNVTVVGDLTLTPDRRDTYFFYTTLSGEQTGVYTFIANRNVETCTVEPNSAATCEIVGGNTIEVTLVVDENVNSYDGVVTVTDENDYVASSTLVVRIFKIWGSIPIGNINVGPLSDLLSIIFETDGDFLIGIRSWFAGSVILLFGFTFYKSYRA